MVCSCETPSKCVSLQILFWSCVIVDTPLCKKMADRFLELSVRECQRVSESDSNMQSNLVIKWTRLPQNIVSRRSIICISCISLRQILDVLPTWQITIFCSTSPNNCKTYMYVILQGSLFSTKKQQQKIERSVEIFYKYLTGQWPKCSSRIVLEDFLVVLWLTLPTELAFTSNT